jgi:hypothetical protein
MTTQNDKVGINWATLIAAAGLGVILVGGFYGIVQTQFAYIDKDKEIIRAQLTKSQDDVARQFKEIKDQNVQQVEFRQFEARVLADIETVKKQLLLLEQTRPTTGELSGTAKALEARITQQEERMRGLELRLIPQSPPTK